MKMRTKILTVLIAAIAIQIVCDIRLLATETTQTESSMDRRKVQFRSTADRTMQEAFIILPENELTEPTALVVSLHSWSADLNQRNKLERMVHDRGWVYLFPDFRGVNQRPQACGSELAQQDILDAIDFAKSNYNIDPERVFLTGNSGGGHMTMLMCGKYPKQFRAASAWVGISDLASWHARHEGSKYGNMLERCCGGKPGDSTEVDRQYKSRSPKTWLHGAKDVALDISAGVNDGHTGSVPIRHSIDAFNLIAKANDDSLISNKEINELSQRGGRLSKPQPSDTGFDQTFNRKIFLRRSSNNAGLTIFDGGHEGIATATMAWFEKHLKSPK